MALRIVIETIPHAKQRYETCGDWYWDPNGTTHIVVSDLGDWRKEACVALHELAELLMCRSDGVTQGDVDEFDFAYEAKRPKGDTSEPGDSPDAPYAKQHVFASAIERVLATAIGLNWTEYENAINAL